MSEKQFSNPAVRWIDHRLPIFSFLNHEANEYPTPKNLNYFWNFGSLAGISLVVMIITGIALSMSYTAHVDYAFESVERIMRDVNHGWLLRYIHMNGASFFFIVVFIHIFRGLYYGSYKAPRELLWILGVVILLLMMATAFMGYVLPWGQMSFWGATVITNLFSAIPGVGEGIVTWLWGGFSVDNPTLNRFFSLHFLLPFVIVGVVVLHLVALHRFGSNNPLGIDTKGPQDTLPFHPYYTIKDFFGLSVFLTFFAAAVFFFPNFMGHPDNYIPANALQTPAHIVPEWYFLPFYAILRAVPDKLGGVLAMFGAIAVLFILPWLDRSPVRSGRFRPVFKIFFWLLLADCVLLGYIGAMPAEGLYVLVGRLATVLQSPVPFFRAFRYIHMQHHKFTNDKTKDPDLYVGSGPGWLLPLKWTTLDINYLYRYLNPSVFMKRPKSERREMLLALFFAAVVLAVISANGWLNYYLLLFLIPGRITAIFLAITFDFLPHYPHQAQAKDQPFQCTSNRVGMEWLLTPVLLFQNYHLVHHLYPTVPFYRLLKIWYARKHYHQSKNPATTDAFSLSPRTDNDLISRP